MWTKPGAGSKLLSKSLCLYKAFSLTYTERENIFLNIFEQIHYKPFKIYDHIVVNCL